MLLLILQLEKKMLFLFFVFFFFDRCVRIFWKIIFSVQSCVIYCTNVTTSMSIVSKKKTNRCYFVTLKLILTIRYYNHEPKI